MWESLEGKYEDTKWLATALEGGTATMVTDGSYNGSLAPFVSGAGWIVACTAQHKILGGWFYERSSKANAYRGELLGMVAVHLLATFVTEFYALPTCLGNALCDNIGALTQASKLRQRIPTGSKHSDLLRSLRSIKSKIPMRFCYSHVRGHQDDFLTWRSLSLVQQLNVQCDAWAGMSITSSIDSAIEPPRESWLLPRESAAVIIDGHKLTSDISDDIRHALGRRLARSFFTAPVRMVGNTNTGGLGWAPDQFDGIDWQAIRTALRRKPEMYGVWLAKQTTGVCATRRNTARIDRHSDDRCPNCLCGPETNHHLTICCDPGRTALFDSDVDHLDDWLRQRGSTDQELAYWLIKYLRFRGECTLHTLGDMSPGMLQVAKAIDRNGWSNFMVGRLPLALRDMHQVHCSLSNCKLPSNSWMATFVSKVLDISHNQWLYRNFTLHNKLNGYLHLQQQEKIIREVAKLSVSNPATIPPESRFLLEVDLTSSLDAAPLSTQLHWTHAMKAALIAGRRTVRQGNRPTGLTQHRSSAPTRSQRVSAYRLQRRCTRLLRILHEELELHPGSSRTKRHWSDSGSTLDPSNKRLRKPD